MDTMTELVEVEPVRPSPIKALIARTMTPGVGWYIRSAPWSVGKRKLWYGFAGPNLSWRSHDFNVKTKFGMRMRGNTKELIDRFIFYFGTWEPNLTNWLLDRLHLGDCFVDVGANVGYHSMLASKLVGEAGSVIAIEASPSIYSRLNANLKQNDIGNVRTVNIAIAEKPGELPIFMGPPENTSR